jgi:preprotein translocase SecF subunit
LDGKFAGTNIQSFGEKGALIRIENHPDITDTQQVVKNVQDQLKAEYPHELTYQRIDSVGPKVGASLVQTSIIAVITSVAAMLLYVWFRFELPFGIGSVVALSHDVLITLGIFAWFHLPFDLSTIAALLTIVGYSMNDTVVIYDRIRENLRKYRKAPLTDLIDLSVNETMTRTIVTTGTVLLALTSLLLFGGEVIRSFIIAMTCGVVIGTYSTVFIASPVLILLGVRREGSMVNPQKNSDAV